MTFGDLKKMRAEQEAGLASVDQRAVVRRARRCANEAQRLEQLFDALKEVDRLRSQLAGVQSA